MKKMENYKMNPHCSMCMNIEDIYEIFSRLMCGKADIFGAD